MGLKEYCWGGGGGALRENLRRKVIRRTAREEGF